MPGVPTVVVAQFFHSWEPQAEARGRQRGPGQALFHWPASDATPRSPSLSMLRVLVGLRKGWETWPGREQGLPGRGSVELVPELCTMETQGGQRGLGQQAEPGNARWGLGRGLPWLFWSWVWAVNVLLLQGSGVYVAVSVHMCPCAPYRAVWLRGGAPFWMRQWGHPEAHLLGWWGPPGACPPRGALESSPSLPRCSSRYLPLSRPACSSHTLYSLPAAARGSSLRDKRPCRCPLRTLRGMCVSQNPPWAVPASADLRFHTSEASCTTHSHTHNSHSHQGGKAHGGARAPRGSGQGCSSLSVPQPFSTC